MVKYKLKTKHFVQPKVGMVTLYCYVIPLLFACQKYSCYSVTSLHLKETESDTVTRYILLNK